MNIKISINSKIIRFLSVLTVITVLALMAVTIPAPESTKAA